MYNAIKQKLSVDLISMIRGKPNTHDQKEKLSEAFIQIRGCLLNAKQWSNTTSSSFVPFSLNIKAPQCGYVLTVGK